jgi:hypothetical protein
MHHPRGKISTQARECIIFSITVFPPAESTALSVVRRFFLRHFEGLSRSGKQRRETNKQPPGPSYVCGNRFSVLFSGTWRAFIVMCGVCGGLFFPLMSRRARLICASFNQRRMMRPRLMQSNAFSAAHICNCSPSLCFGKRMRRDLLCGSISFLCALDEFPEC